MDERPRLRPLEMFPVEADGETLICARDPLGLADPALLRRPAALLAALCDGTRTVTELALEFTRRCGIGVTDGVVSQLLAQLDRAGFLEGAAFAVRQVLAEKEYREARARPAAHAGGSYPGDSAELRGYLDRLEATAPAPEVDAPDALIVPHIDFHRGGAVYARAYRALVEPPELVVVLGTNHNQAEEPFALTAKPYATPLGEVPTDGALLATLTARLGDWLFADELHHRHEHSIEFQAVWLRHRFGHATPPMLPVLCGSLHREVDGGASPRSDARRADFLDALAGELAGRSVLVVAGADLAHVGPHFGDVAPMGGKESRDRVERDDRSALAAAAAGDAEGFFQAVAGCRDRNRVCGLAPIWAALALRPLRRGMLLDYAQCGADPAGDSFVSIASMALWV